MSATMVLSSEYMKMLDRVLTTMRIHWAHHSQPWFGISIASFDEVGLTYGSSSDGSSGFLGC